MDYTAAKKNTVVLAPSGTSKRTSSHHSSGIQNTMNIKFYWYEI